jgi:5-methyltetrahydrofolate--homocysteine methyltransferase
MPPFLGLKIFRDIDLNSIIPLINWRMYFSAWDLRPSQYTEAHQNLESDSRILLKEITEKKLLRAAAVVGFFEVQRIGDSLSVLREDGCEVAKLHFLRQQKALDCENFISMADFFNPKEKDFIGLFAATAGLGAGDAEKTFTEHNDDYSALMLKLLADRLAEALTEKLHRDILGGVGIRAAPGYPASPDHTEKAAIWKLLEPEKNIGVSLTENYAMNPVASECGYFAMHPQSRYFKLGKIGEDQLAEYALRKGMAVEEVRKWLMVSGLQ